MALIASKSWVFNAYHHQFSRLHFIHEEVDLMNNRLNDVYHTMSILYEMTDEGRNQLVRTRRADQASQMSARVENAHL